MHTQEGFGDDTFTPAALGAQVLVVNHVVPNRYEDCVHRVVSCIFVDAKL